MLGHNASAAACKTVLLALATVITTVALQPPAITAEGSTSSRCFYLDPVNGNDRNDGSLEHPWRSFANIFSYYKPDYRPPGWVDLHPGDCIYLADGVYSELIHPGEWKQGPEGGGSFVAYFRGEQSEEDKPFGLKACPGHHPVIDPGGKGIGISIFQSSQWDIQGIEVRNAYQRGISLNESQEVKLHDVHIHDTDGIDNNNIAGLYITDCFNVEVCDSIFDDNYDRTCADTNGHATENSCNVVIFGGMKGGNITIHDCIIGNSIRTSGLRVLLSNNDKIGGGLKYKHASRLPEAYFHVHHNTFIGCNFFAFGSGTANTRFHDNIIVSSAGISSRDFGGITHQVNQLFEDNVIYIAGSLGQSRSPFHFDPTTRWRNDDFPDDPKSIVFKNNIVYDEVPYDNERGAVTVGTYIPDDVYYATINQLTLDRNCYYNPFKQPQFNFAAGFNYKDDYKEGGVYSLQQWQNQYGYDTRSQQGDPLFLDRRKTPLPLDVARPFFSFLGRLDVELLMTRQRWTQALKLLRLLPPDSDLYPCMCDDSEHQHRSTWREMMIVTCLLRLDRKDQARKELKSIFEGKPQPGFIILDEPRRLLVELETANGYDRFEQWLAQYAPSQSDFSLRTITQIKKQIESGTFDRAYPILASIDYHHRFMSPIKLKWYQQVVLDALKRAKDKGSLEDLLEKLNSTDPQINRHVSRGVPYAIGHIGDLRAIEHLQRAQKDPRYTNTHFQFNLLAARAKLADATVAPDLFKTRTGNLLHQRHINTLLQMATGASFGRITTREDAAAVFEKWQDYLKKHAPPAK